MTTYFLALVMVFNMNTKAPAIAAPFTSQEQCMLQAEARTRALPQEQRDKGLMYVCLKIEYPGVV